MRVRSAAIGTMVLAAALAGCGSGGGGGGRSSGSTVAGVVTSISPVSSGLNLAARDAAGYTWDTNFFHVNQVAGGTIEAIAQPSVAPTNSSLVVAHSPMGRIDSIDNGVSRGEASLVVDISSVAAISTTILASTSNPGAPGGGDVYLRQGNAWQMVLDTPYAETVVAALGEDVYAFSGEAGGRPAVVSLMQAASGAHFVSDIAVIGSFIPTAAIAFRNEVFVGLTDNGLGGGAAHVYRGTGSTWREILSLGGSGQARVTDMIVVNGLSLIVAVANYDAATGVARNGSVYHFDGERLEVLTSFNGEAPLALCEQDQTVYVGTSRGRLVFRDATGRWVDDPTLPQGVLEIGALLAANQAETMVGVRMADGAHVYRRIANSGGVALPPPPPTPTPTPTPTPQPTGPSYATDVKPILAAKCAACHVTGALAGGTSLVFSDNTLSNNAADYAMLTRLNNPLTNPTTPTSSLLYVKGNNTAMNHTGQDALEPAQETVILNWIGGGRRQ